MKTIKVSEATGQALDWLVAKIEGMPLRLDPMGFKADAPGSAEAGWWVWLAQPGSMLIGPGGDTMDRRRYSPSTNWAQGGPLKQREGITSGPCPFGGYWAGRGNVGDETVMGEYGATELQAITRCFIANRLGDIAEVPEELG